MRRVALILGALAVALVLFLVLRPGGDDEAAVEPASGTTAAGTTTEASTTAEATTGETTTSEGPAEPAPSVVVFQDGRIRGGLQRLRYEKGDLIRLIVRADIADHVHVHGFDLFADVAPGRPARLTFRADLTGSFDIELEDRGVPLAELQVRP